MSFANALDSAGVRTCDVFERGQGYKDGGEDYRSFLSAVLNNQVKTAPNFALRSAFNEARIVSDVSANMKLAKCSDGAMGRRKSAAGMTWSQLR